MRQEDTDYPDIDALERLLRRLLPVLALLALCALAATAWQSPAGEGRERPLAETSAVIDAAPAIDHAVVEPLALPEESVMAGASIAAYER